MDKYTLLATLATALVLGEAGFCFGFQSTRQLDRRTGLRAGVSENDDFYDDRAAGSSDSELSRRDACRSMVGTVATMSSGLVSGSHPASAMKEDENGYAPAIRPTAYRIDSTIPPTLLPLNNAREEKSTLGALGRGSGTDKEEIKIDTVNLNNFMNKLVFGSIDFVAQTVSQTKDESKTGPGYASFVCMGLPSKVASSDIDLASGLLNSMMQGRDSKLASALGLFFCPMSVQPALDSYKNSGDDSVLRSAMENGGVAKDTIDMYMPLLRSARSRSIDLLAMSPEYEDINAARTKGLASVDFDRRQSYVLDPQGFIDVTKDPRYKLYTDRSLLKDFVPLNDEDSIKGFFAEKIFVHETGASVVAKYAVDKPESLVTIVAPTADVRYLQGVNGRIPRIYGSLVKQINANSQQTITSKVSNDAVTTVLINPTASDTLSAGTKLRLEIGTGPDTLDYQTKIADYIWFSSSPKVSLIPRMMN